jgi:hypothetical protein
MRAQQNLLARFTELSIDLRGAVARLTERSATADVDREAVSAHQHNVEVHLARLVEETLRSRSALAEELRNGLDDVNRALGRLGGRPDPEADREALANLQRSVEGQLARLVEEGGLNRNALAEDLKIAVGNLADRFADVDREAMAARHRAIETHLARLVEETAHNRRALADEIRNEIRLLARTIALARGHEATPGE